MPKSTGLGSWIVESETSARGAGPKNLPPPIIDGYLRDDERQYTDGQWPERVPGLKSCLSLVGVGSFCLVGFVGVVNVCVVGVGNNDVHASKPSIGFIVVFPSFVLSGVTSSRVSVIRCSWTIGTSASPLSCIVVSGISFLLLSLEAL